MCCWIFIVLHNYLYIVMVVSLFEKLFESVSVLYGILFDFQSWFVVQQHWLQYYRIQWKKYFADWISILFSNRLIRESSQVLNC